MMYKLFSNGWERYDQNQRTSEDFLFYTNKKAMKCHHYYSQTLVVSRSFWHQTLRQRLTTLQEWLTLASFNEVKLPKISLTLSDVRLKPINVLGQ